MAQKATDTQPKDMRSVTPILMMKDAAKAIDFYKDVLGATEKFRMDGPDGKVMHAQLEIGDSGIMLGEVCPEMDMKPTSNNVCVYVQDADAAFKKAKEKGARILEEPADQFWGDRTATFTDPFGQTWTVATHVEDVSEEEIRRRGKKMMEQREKAA